MLSPPRTHLRTSIRLTIRSSFVVAAALTACGSSSSPTPDAPVHVDAAIPIDAPSFTDGPVTIDAPAPVDVPPAVDATDAPPAIDAATVDAITIDSSPPIDAAPRPDVQLLDDGGIPDIAIQLAAIPGVTVREGSSPAAGYRYFAITFDQPADHANPAGVRFQQRLSLLHRDVNAPMVLATSGYFLDDSGSGLTEPASMVSGNQILVEHRFFEPSRPDPTDWTDLTIQQSAADFHAITTAFKTIYGANWITTGASKGGDTMIYYRRFYPDDVNGTVAYVAPNCLESDLVSPDDDTRTIEFIRNIGTDPTCLANLHAFQQMVLMQRPAMTTFMDSLATDDDTSWTEVLGEQKALEFANVEMPFIFWQYGNQTDCARIPGATATAEQIFGFLDQTVDVYSYSDVDLLESTCRFTTRPRTRWGR